MRLRERYKNATASKENGKVNVYSESGDDL